MKDFEKMAKKVLEERKKSEKEQQEKAEKIIEKAIKFFEDIGVESVHIEIKGESSNTIAVYSGKKEKGGVINVPDKESVFDIVKDILISENSKIRQYFTISVNPESILIRLKDNAWTKKEEIFLLFSFYIRKFNTEQKFYFFYKKVLTKWKKEYKICTTKRTRICKT